MTVQVRLFASLSERLGRSDLQLPVTAGTTVGDIWQQVLGDMPAPANVLAAVNLDYVDFSAPVKDGDEVAFFPPVTGG
ncbi:MAG: MoaD/ThiS family protein [Gammaproteobacteria bacterium]|nr:MoaD/ThiS family protein [Gammaproteobacteria bacterium]